MFETTRFLDLECVRLGNESLSLLVTQSVGPRIISLQVGQGPNLFAELPDFTLECPGEGQFHIRGGHRLWYAPEAPKITYLPDDEPVQLKAIESGLMATQPLEEKTGIQKSIRIWLPNEDPIVIVDHKLTNKGASNISCAPWAITQLKVGGTAILPQNTAFNDLNGLQPNRSVALWPYSDVASSNIAWGNRYILIKALLSEGALKVGFPNFRGWLAYHLDDYLFVKKAIHEVDGNYYDLGSSSQCYCNDRFLELETLGQKSMLEPGASIRHREVWELYQDVHFKPDEDVIDELLERIGLS
jgi:hypothetical protein